MTVSYEGVALVLIKTQQHKKPLLTQYVQRQLSLRETKVFGFRGKYGCSIVEVC